MPAAKISWILNGKELSASDGVKIEHDSKTGTSHLLIPKASSSLSGSYIIRASNDYGTEEASFTLEVFETAKIKGKLENIAATEGNEARFLLRLSGGKPRPTVKWFHNEEEVLIIESENLYEIIQTDEAIEFVIKNVKSENSGTYYAKVVNDAGQSVSNKAQLVVSRSPKIIKIADHQERYNRDEAAKFEVFIDAYPSATVNWILNGKELTNKDGVQIDKDLKEGRYSLTIPKVNSGSHSGTLTVKATNNIGSTTHDIKIVVLDAPKILGKLENVTTSEGSSVEFSCRFISCPPVTSVQWLKNGTEEVIASENIEITTDEESSTLKLLNVQSSETGSSYQIRLTNDLGELLSNKASLLINSEPSFQSELNDRTVLKDKELKVELVITGNPKPQVQWLLNGKELTLKDSAKVEKDVNNNKYTLTIQKASVSGVLTVKAINSSGTVERSCNIDVSEAPKSITKLENVTIVEGEEAKFALRFSGKPKPSVRWFKDDTELVDGEEIKIETSEDESYLTISKCEYPKNSGNYFVKLSNQFGEITSQKASLTINKLAKFIVAPNDAVGIQDTPARFECAIESVSKYKVSWFFNNKEITSKENIKIETDNRKSTSTLVISKVTPGNLGRYTIKVSNAAGEIEHSFNLEVFGAPKIYGKLENVTVNNGDNGKFVLRKSGGKPKPIVKWFKNDVELQDDDQAYEFTESEDTAELIVKNVTVESAGSYYATITNEAGQVMSSKANLNVSNLPIFTLTPQDSVVVQDLVARFACSVESNPKAKLVWYLNDKELTVKDNVKFENDAKTSTQTLVIPKISSSFIGKYTIKASNAVGEIQHSFNVDTIQGPKILGKLDNVITNEGLEVRLSIKTSTCRPKPEVKVFRNDEELPESDDYEIIEGDDLIEFVIKSVKIENSGNYYIKLSNGAGQVVSNKCTITVNRLPAFVKLPEVEEAYKTDSSVKFETLVDATPQATLSWILNGKELSNKDGVLIEKDVPNKRYALTINKLNQNVHSGTLTVKASNSIGTVTHDISIKILDLPKIKGKLENVSTSENQTAEFTCKFFANPKPSKLIWLQNETIELSASENIEIINTDETSTLKILNCKPADSGKTILVKVVNDMGEVLSNKATLTISSGPVIQNDLQDVKVLKEKEAKFEVFITGNPKPQVQWLLNSKELTVRDGGKIEKDVNNNRYALTIPKVNTSGVITVKASNEYGSTEKSCNINLLDVPRALNKLDNLTINETEEAKFTIKVSGNPKPTTKWFKNDTELVSSEQYDISAADEEVTLLIKGCKSEDAGQYYAKLSNEFGETSTNKATLNVNKGPVFTLKPSDAVAVQDSEIRFECSVEGTPKPKVTWYFNGRELTVRDVKDFKIEADQKTSEHALVITKCAAHHLGKFIVKASNTAGEVEHAFTLDVLRRFI